jgi:GNAT superfamily N-acetyltransferase
MAARSEGIRVERLDASRRADFFRVHAPEQGEGWCCCVAWWVAGWDGWQARSAEENRAIRDRLFDSGEHDGYMAYEGDLPVGWCQVGPRDRLRKLAAQFDLPADPGAWAVTCFVVVPGARRRGVARRMLEAEIADLPGRGARRLEAFPRRVGPAAGVGAGVGAGATETEPGALWTGPEQLYRDAGFRERGERGGRLVMELDLAAGG